MTENEAKEMLQAKLTCLNLDGLACVGKGCSRNCNDCEYYYAQGTIGKQEEAIKVAVSIFEEIQQYRALGTVKELKNCKNILNKSETDELAKIIDEWLLYHKIGTPEELREAVEKQRTKKPSFEGDGYDNEGNMIYDTWICPFCNKDYEVDYDEYDYCPNCGQKIDWSDKE